MKIPLEGDVAARIEAKLAKFSRGWEKLELDSLRRATSFKVLILCEMLGGRTKAAKAAELSDNTLDNYRHGIKDPTYATLGLMAEKAGIASRYLGGEWSLEADSIRIDLFDHLGAMRFSPPPGLMDNPSQPYIHGYDEIRPSSAAAVAVIEDYWARLGINPDAVTALLAEGDSMAPTIADQAPLFVDTGDRELADGGIYALRIENRLVIRRVQRLIEGGVQLLADNSAVYPSQTIGPSLSAELEVIGRVRSAVIAC